MLHDDGSPSTPSRSKKRTPHGELHFQRSTKPSAAYIKHRGTLIPVYNWMLTCLGLQLKRQTAPFQLFSAPKYSILRYLNQHLQHYRQTHLQLTRLPFTTQNVPEPLRQMPRPSQYPLSRRQHHIRTSLRTCPLATTLISPVIPPLRELPRVDMARTSMLVLRYTASHLCDSIVSGCC